MTYGRCGEKHSNQAIETTNLPVVRSGAESVRAVVAINRKVPIHYIEEVVVDQARYDIRKPISLHPRARQHRGIHVPQIGLYQPTVESSKA